MMNKKELSKYYYLSLEIKSLEERILTIRNKSVGISNITGMPFSMNKSNPVEKQIQLIATLTERLELKKAQALEEMLKIEQYINTIKDVETRLIFSKRYIELKKWDLIAREMYMSERSVFRKHSNYLRKGTYEKY